MAAVERRIGKDRERGIMEGEIGSGLQKNLRDSVLRRVTISKCGLK